MQNTEENTQKIEPLSKQEALNAIGLQLDERTGKISIKDLSVIYDYIHSLSYSFGWEEVKNPIYPDIDALVQELLENSEHYLGCSQKEFSDELQSVFREALGEIDKKKNERYLSEISFSCPDAIASAEHMKKSKKIIYKGKQYYPAVILFVDERYYFRRNREEGTWWIRTDDAHLLLPRNILTLFSYDPQNGFSWIQAENTMFTQFQTIPISMKVFDISYVWKETSVVSAGLYPVVEEKDETQLAYIPVEDARKALVENRDIFDTDFNRFLLVPKGDVRVFPDFPEDCSKGTKPCHSLAKLSY